MFGPEMHGVVLGALVVLGVLIMTVVFQVLWTMTMPEVFGLKPIRYWVAFRLLLTAHCSFLRS
ncbi:MAG: hypothetical protein H6Q86_1536 [candidate division NC10 bacterium]|jgi:hypothetical protein|nr:hypothetical protein [candidate division NC10 bacterium]